MNPEMQDIANMENKHPLSNQRSASQSSDGLYGVWHDFVYQTHPVVDGLQMHGVLAHFKNTSFHSNKTKMSILLSTGMLYS